MHLVDLDGQIQGVARASDRDQVQVGTAGESGRSPPRFRSQVVADQTVSGDADEFSEKVVEYVGIYFQDPSSPWNHSTRLFDQLQ